MYKVNVTSSGKYNNVMTGARYCLTARSVIRLGRTFQRMEADFDIQKLVRLHGDVFCWNDIYVGAKIWNKILENA